MKTLKSICIALFLISLNATESTALNNSANAASYQQMRGLTYVDITVYLSDHGHTCITTPFSKDGGYSWYCQTSYNGHTWNTTVHTDGTNIVDFDDIMVD